MLPREYRETKGCETQPRSQSLLSYRPWSDRGKTLAHAGHVFPRILEMTVKLLKDGRPSEKCVHTYVLSPKETWTNVMFSGNAWR